MAAENLQKPLVRIGADRGGDAAGVLLRLLQDGTSPSVPDGDLGVFPGTFRSRGDEDAIVTLADLDLHRVLRTQADNVILLQAFPLFVDAKRTERRVLP